MTCAFLTLVTYISATPAARAQKQDLDAEFKAAVAQYESHKYPEAATQLEKLVREVPESFEVQELLGLVYAAQSQNDKANEHLEKAVRLKPDSATARTNLGNNLLRLGKLDLAEQQFKRAAALAPQDYEANHNLGEFYARSNKIAEAVPLFERAQQIDPSAYDNGYDLALAYLLTRTLERRAELNPQSGQTKRHRGTAQSFGRGGRKGRQLRGCGQ